MFRVLIFCVAPAVSLYGTGFPRLFWASIVVGILGFWSWNAMHSHAMQLAKLRYNRLAENLRVEGRSHEEIERVRGLPNRPSSREIDSVPNWIAVVDMLATVAAFVLLVWGIVIRFT